MGRRRFSGHAIVALCVLSTLLPGCAFNKARGASFQSRDSQVAPEKALIYVYRPLGESFGYNRTYFLMSNEGKLTDLLHGGYLPYEVTPGKVILYADVNVLFMTALTMTFWELIANPDGAKLELNVEVGRTYYVRFTPKTHFTHFTPHFYLMAQEEAEPELRKCKLLEMAEKR